MNNAIPKIIGVLRPVAAKISALFTVPSDATGFDAETVYGNDTVPLTGLDNPLDAKAYASQQPALDGVLIAMASALEQFFITKVEPVVRNAPHYRYRVRTIQISETHDNTAHVSELRSQPKNVQYDLTTSVFRALTCTQYFDLSRFYGIQIVPSKELIDRSVTTWAAVGAGQIGIDFFIDGVTFDTRAQEAAPITPTAAPSQAIEANDFHLKLIDKNGARELKITGFPSIIGTDENAAIRVAGNLVSHQHLVLHWDSELQCAYVIDRSRNGTYTQNGRKLHERERVYLLRKGSLTLTQSPDAPCLEYWYGDASRIDTPLAFSMESAPQTEVPVPASTGGGDSARPLPATPLENVDSLSPPVASAATGAYSATSSQSHQARRRGVQETQFSEEHDMVHERSTDIALDSPLAYLQVRNARNQTEVVPVSTLPFSIGREFAGKGFRVDEAHSKVSRLHLCIVEKCANGLGVTNTSQQRERAGQSNLTYDKDGAQAGDFLWIPRNVDDEGGWLTLGSPQLDDRSIEVRLLSVACFEGSKA